MTTPPHPTFHRLSGLYIGDAGGRGRGLFCAHDIAAGTMIETAPVLLFNEREAKHIEATSLTNYYFSANFLPPDMAKARGIGDAEKAGALPLGALCFCNHSESPNAEAGKEIHGDEIFFTLRSLSWIRPHTEILIHYGRLWFDPAG
jgi:hypothetical protein